MPTPGERRALIFLASVAALGVGARGWTEWRSGTGPALAGDRAALARQIEAVDSAIVAGGEKRSSPRTTRGKRAAAGAAKAEVPPASSRSRPVPVEEPPPPRDMRAMYRLRWQHHDSVQAVGARRTATRPPASVRPAPSIRTPAPTGPPALVDLDVASAVEIEALPWIGRALATQIVTDRQAHGPFGSLAGLQRVPGIGPGTAARLQPYVTFSLPPRLGSTVESWPRARRRRRPGR